MERSARRNRACRRLQPIECSLASRNFRGQQGLAGKNSEGDPGLLDRPRRARRPERRRHAQPPPRPQKSPPLAWPPLPPREIRPVVWRRAPILEVVLDRDGRRSRGVERRHLRRHER